MDRGNTALDCLLTGPGLQRRQRISVSSPGLQEFLAGQRPQLALGLSVVAGGLDLAVGLLQDLGCSLQHAGTDLPCPLDLDYPLEQLGVDRWVAALAAQRRFGDALVVDCGSALTLDLVSAAGRFHGGMIAAGADALRLGLAAVAPALPDPQAGNLPALPVDNSCDSVSAGVNYGFLCLVDGLVDRLLASSVLESPTLVLTGGDADIVIAHSRHRFAHLPELIHEGLRCLLNSNRSRS